MSVNIIPKPKHTINVNGSIGIMSKIASMLIFIIYMDYDV